MNDHHFLERLERLGWRETELALGLYREPELVRLVLDSADAPEAARLAIALSDSPDPSYLVVARDGAFVTCLAPGMSPDETPVVAFEDLGVASERHAALRRLTAVYERTAGDAGRVEQLWRQLYEDAERLPRTALAELAPLTALFAGDLPEAWTREGTHVRTLVYEDGPRLLRDRDRLTDADVERLREIWRSHWATGHLVGLFGLQDKATLDRLDGELATIDGATVIGVEALELGFWPVALRGAWTGARFGAGALTRVEAALTERDAPEPFAFSAALQIAFIGAARGALRQDVRETLRPSRDLGDESTPTEVLRWALARALGPDLLTDLAGGREQLRKIGVEQAPPDAGPIPPDIVGFGIANHRGNVFADGYTMGLALSHLGWLARTDLLDFYPDDHVLAELPAWTPEDSLALLEGAVAPAPGTSAPVRRAPKVGRNAPCPCGSGKKFKRCCGA